MNLIEKYPGDWVDYAFEEKVGAMSVTYLSYLPGPPLNHIKELVLEHCEGWCAFFKDRGMTLSDDTFLDILDYFFEHEKEIVSSDQREEVVLVLASHRAGIRLDRLVPHPLLNHVARFRKGGNDFPIRSSSSRNRPYPHRFRGSISGPFLERHQSVPR